MKNSFSIDFYASNLLFLSILFMNFALSTHRKRFLLFLSLCPVCLCSICSLWFFLHKKMSRPFSFSVRLPFFSAHSGQTNLPGRGRPDSSLPAKGPERSRRAAAFSLSGYFAENGMVLGRGRGWGAYFVQGDENGRVDCKHLPMAEA